MADKNQLSLANGVPPQFSTGNSTPQTTCGPQSQAQRGLAPGVNNCLNSDQFQKLQTSMVNGQISPNTRINNWDQQSGQSNMNVNYNSSSTGNISFNQQSLGATQTQHQMPFHTTKSSLTYSGNINPKLPLNVHSNINQPSVSMGTQSNTITPPASFNQMSPNIPSSKQNILKPLPVIGSSSNVLTTGVLQPVQSGSGDAPQNQVFQNVTKAKSLVTQYSSTHKITGPPTMQMNKPLYGPSTTVVPSKLSPHNKPIVAISPYSDYVSPPTSQNVNVSQHKTPIPGSQSNQIFSNVSPSFQQLSAQNLTGIPQGYQPQNFMPNQMPSKTSLSNPSYTSENQPTYNYSKSEHGAQNYQSQGLGNRNFGPPQMGSLSASNSVPHQQSPFTSETPANNPYGNVKTSGMNALMGGIERMSVTHQGFNKLWGMETIDLLQCRNILPPQKVTPPPIRLHQEFMDNVNCSPDIFRCTLNRIPETNSLLQKSRLPLGILIHPFRDLDQLPVIQCSSIVRCRACRTYINPFVYFVDNKRWKCNLCFRVNELPDEFQYDPVSKTYGDPSRRPEIRSSTIEFIAPSEYMLRPPQPAIYLFVLDVSRWGCDSGYLHTLCSVLLEELDNIPGDSRTQIGFILFDSTIHFFSIAENYNQAHEMIVTDIDDVFLPTPDSLLVNLNENRQLIKDLLKEIPKKYAESYDTDSCLGPALQAAFKLMSPTGGRITVFQSCLPNKGPGVLSPREDPNQRSSKDVRHLGPQTDFYKRLSLDCSTQQISVDLFLVSSQYSDLSTLGGISQFSGGCIYYFPLFRRINPESNERLSRALRRYLTRKIGFEAVMRVRCSRGLSIHTFHGNFFVRSTDLLSLPNVNPDAGFGMQIAIEDSLCELQCVCFQAAVLYTSAKGERRIRVHTLCLPVSSNLSDILTSADQQAIVGLLAKMAVDRSLKSSLSDAREAFINVAIDILSAYKLVETSGGQNAILAPVNLSLIPLYILALLKSTAFRTGQNTRLDDRVNAMSQMKTLPLRDLIQLIHPDLYHVTHLDEKSGVEFEDKLVAQPPRLSLSSEHLDSRGAFLLDTPEVIYLLVGRNVSTEFLVNIFDVRDIRQINKDMVDLPELENDESDKLRHFINFLQSDKPWPSVIKVVTEPIILTPFLINDKAENALSYHELLHHVKAQLK